MPAKYLIMILYGILIQSDSGMSIGLTNHDFCMKQTSKCSGKFSFECKPDKCSIDKKACDYFNSLAFVLNSYRWRTSYPEEKKKFDSFKSLIKNCQLTRYEWKPADLCFKNSNDCQTLDLDVITGIRTIKSVGCSCAGKHSFKCGENVCSVDKRSCEHFQKNGRATKMASKLKLVSSCSKQKEKKISVKKMGLYV